MISEYTLEVLEYKKLLAILADGAHCPATREAVLEIRPLRERQEILSHQKLVADIRKMSAQGQPLRLTLFSDLSPLLERIRPAGAVLESFELSMFIPVLRLAAGLSAQVGEAEGLPSLKDLIRHLKGFPDLLVHLERALDDQGNILDQASPWLQELRREVRKLEAQLRKNLEEVILDHQVAPFLQDDFITQRSGRWVIPVRMDSKGQVPGVVHDVSRSGETAFIEPLAIISEANRLENLMADQRAEEIRILRELSSLIRKEADDLAAEQRTLIRIDLLAGLAAFGDRLKMANPEISEGVRIHLARGRHPLLTLAYERRKTAGKVVPLDLELGGESRVMVITGVNAGGKTIALKTAGLLWLMALSGMPVPADSSSAFSLLDDLQVDIGDEQSIESSLSTFSAHISRISGILKRADSKTLVLMDELGTSTDPVEGAAIACAVLKDLQERGALVLATTHLTEIKGFVHRSEGMVNASMAFDQETLTPLYRLRIGEPGQSHALEIARRYGLPERILESARGFLTGREEGFEKLIADLNAKRKVYEAALEALRDQQETVLQQTRRLEKRLLETEKTRKDILAKAYQEGLEISAAVKREMNLLLEEMKHKEKAERKQALLKVREEERALTDKLRQLQGDETRPLSLDTIKVGDWVYVRSLGRDAEVLAIQLKQERLKVVAEGREIEVPLLDAGPRKSRTEKPGAGTSFRGLREETIPDRIKVIGLRVEEALSEIEPFLNHAFLAGLQEVIIVHGLGTGILMKAIREYLKGHPLVTSHRKGTPAEGGNAVTIVRLND
jgi:DNA mismatch repair protein MutS2